MTAPRTRNTPTEFLEPLRQALQDRYVLGAELGRGAMSVVYRARDLRYDREVAVKVLRAEVSLSVGTERFLQEIAIAARLQHPHILPLLDSGEAAGLLYYVMPCVEGQSLRERLDAEPQLPISEALRIAREVGTALAYAHDHGVIHRDIKPANILLSSGVAIVADFGIARAVVEAGGEKFSTGGLVLGTPGYMSPEQAVGEPRLDGRSDIFSLGCVLYEMLAGEPPFTGPTPQAVTARLVQAPMPPLRVVRGSISPPLERVVERALAKIPADRFQTAGEFVHALESVHVDVPHPAASTVRSRPWKIVALALAAVALVGVILSWPAVEEFRDRVRSAAIPADTTRIVLFPLEQDGPAGEQTIHDHLLHTALSRWRGIVLVERYQVADALRRRAPLRSSEDAGELARSLGAGRYIRGSLVSVGDSTDASAALFDVGSPHPLARSVERVPPDPTAASAAYARLARELLLRSGGADLLEDSVTGPRSLPAVQAFGRAQMALDEWDLAAADSAFQRAVEFDPTDARAQLWLAQVRSWRELPPTTWSVVAERAVAGSAALSERERVLASALVFLARRQYGSACNAYEALRVRNDRDFAAWFGLGECRRRDGMVVSDSTSPSKWRFRSSYHRAMEAYSKAFEVLPSVHRGFERGAFDRLRVLLLVSNTLNQGFSVVGSDTTRFLARPSWRGDTLSLVPYPWAVVGEGGSAATPPGFAEALEHQRTQFRRIADGWSAAFPRSSGAKEAVAMALELQGDPAAIDTLLLARQLASDSARKMRLAATEAMLLLKFGTPDHHGYLRRARALADSLLAVNGRIAPPDQQLFGAVAALVGRCDIAEQSARQSQSPPLGFSSRVMVEADALLARVSLGCRLGPQTANFTALFAAIASDRRVGGADERRQAEEFLLLRHALLAPALDSMLLDRLGRSSTHPLLRAARANARHDAAAVRAELSAFGALATPGTPMGPDLAYPGARLWAAIGDTTAAIAWLDRTLSDVTSYDPLTFTDGAIVASFIRATSLRAQLARATKDTAGATRWSAPASILWENADPEIRQAVRRGVSSSPNRP